VISQDDLGHLQGLEVFDTSGERVGPVEQVYVDPESGDPLWVTVRTGTLSFQKSFVPLTGARLDDGWLIVAVDRERVTQAPIRQTDVPLSREDADRLSAYYGLGGADDAMTRSEERLVAGTVREPTTKVRLRKYLVTEEVQVTVPVTREEVRLEEVPVTADDEPKGDDGVAPDMILHAERPVVTTESVPVERVRLSKETVRDEEVISAPVRRERIDLETEPTDEPGRPG
jgi:uncharacterized protein (TIGR02271 family)